MQEEGTNRENSIQWAKGGIKTMHERIKSKKKGFHEPKIWGAMFYLGDGTGQMVLFRGTTQ